MKQEAIAQMQVQLCEYEMKFGFTLNLHESLDYARWENCLTVIRQVIEFVNLRGARS